MGISEKNVLLIGIPMGTDIGAEGSTSCVLY